MSLSLDYQLLFQVSPALLRVFSLLVIIGVPTAVLASWIFREPRSKK
jgi:hypothetical protein